MCGLTGVAGDITYKEIDAFKQLLYISSLRGWDSTGVAVLTRQGGKSLSSTVVRSLGPSHNLLDSKHFDKAMALTNKKVLMGHCRAATVGSVRVSNAHPFEFDNYVGAHNGTLDYSARRGLEDHLYYDTDSEALIANIDSKGVPDVIRDMEGAWALSLANKENGTLEFIRNNKRDLCFCFNKSGQALFWASEADFLRFVLRRNDIEIQDQKVFRFTEDVHYIYKIPLNTGKFEVPERHKSEGRKALFSPFHRSTRSQNFGAGNRTFGGNDNNHRAAFSVIDRTRAKAREQTNVVRLMTKHNIQAPDSEDETCGISLLPKFHGDFYETRGKRRSKHYVFKALGGRYWDSRLFMSLTKHGCAFCGETPNWGDNIVLCRDNIFTCQKCSGDEGIEMMIQTGNESFPVMSASENTELNDPLPTIN